MIISLGFLLVVSLLVNGALLAMMDRLSNVFPELTVLLANVLNTVISFVVITILFGTIFKVLPDAKIMWRDVRMGAFLQPVYSCWADLLSESISLALAQALCLESQDL